ncbi:uncharacterized protein Fot_42340 [Forsythia ovata]|uniref:Uncharacterized protein n=1 Tax=Forsythia ovata TaxID=205694 RepID=A0ABD1RKW2_9LAMI
MSGCQNGLCWDPFAAVISSPNLGDNNFIELKACLDNVHKLKSLQGKLGYIQRFISNLLECCYPFNMLGEERPLSGMIHVKIHFKSIDERLSHLVVLATLIPQRPLTLYVAPHEYSLGVFLV